MLSQDVHITDKELLQAADGELPRRRAEDVRAHLAACWNCRVRMADIEGTIADFMRGHRQTLDAQLPPAEGPRALLRAQLTELAHTPVNHSPQWLLRYFKAPRAAIVGVSALIAVLICVLILQRSILNGPDASVASTDPRALPERSLTPGATRIVAISDVCSMPHEEVVREVPASLREEVLKKYKMNARAGDYEIDYLIAPGLGGAEDIQNLWPEPFKSVTWNAYVKDALEERLHQLVCSGDLDLSTAQRDIATDWIAAYKKYFHTEMPVSPHADAGLVAPRSEIGEPIRMCANQKPHRIRIPSNSHLSWTVKG
jgi:hypothetical protein